MLELSEDQSKVVNSILDWLERPVNFLTLGGYAGTGKTTLIAYLRSKLYERNPKLKFAFCAYTGKAARVLQQKMQAAGVIYPQDNISTIHSLMYSPMLNNSQEIIGWERKEEIKYDLIVVDEASMVDGKIWQDLLAYNIPILAVGDHGQLPPISGNFNLMDNPMLKLTQIHRQAEGNPIIQLSIQAREEGEIKPGKYGPGVYKLSRNDSNTGEDINERIQNYKSDTLWLCGYNHTRVKLNKSIRQALEFESSEPQKRDRVICLRNNHAQQIFNGMLGTIKDIKTIDDDWYGAEIEMDGESKVYKGIMARSQFNSTEGMNFTAQRGKTARGDLFDFGYALTVHKAQGSQSPRVILFEERFAKMDDEMWRRWLYTAVTRAESELIIYG
jgi:exodeoxyribonuclease V